MFAHVGQKVIMVLAALPRRWLHPGQQQPWLLRMKLICSSELLSDGCWSAQLLCLLLSSACSRRLPATMHS
jgi:hypothetical protein